MSTVRVKADDKLSLHGKRVAVGNGAHAEFDGTGVAEVSPAVGFYLLSGNGYSLVSKADEKVLADYKAEETKVSESLVDLGDPVRLVIPEHAGLKICGTRFNITAEFDAFGAVVVGEEAAKEFLLAAPNKETAKILPLHEADIAKVGGRGGRRKNPSSTEINDNADAPETGGENEGEGAGGE